ncbi:MAG: toxin-antitoxin system HicB family antitoxin [Pirellulales bacterium]|nr:toxin-antitoxin system HicB family antitoxin [Pirellulales bacterium]
MIECKERQEVKQAAEEFLAHCPDWVTFYREILGLNGVIRHTFPTREELAAFKQTEEYQEILQMLARLRQQGPAALDETEPTRVITVRLPKSLHESLRAEAFDHHTSMNKLCISKLIHFIEGESVPSEIETG